MPEAQRPAATALSSEPARSSNDRVRWYLNRLSRMSPAEIVYRIVRALATQAERFGLRTRRTAAPPDLTQHAGIWISSTIATDVSRYFEAADRIASGKLDVFELRGIHLGSPPNWNRDPKTGIAAPLSFGKLINYRDPALVGDHKYLWEPNRHMQMVTLAQAWALGGEPRHARALADQLESWFDACPQGQGPNWASALEAGLRLINWSIAWQLIGAAQSPLFNTPAGQRLRERWLDSVHQHACFIRGYFSLHSSANNHLIGEAAGLFVAAATWPHWPETSLWLAESQAILEAETARQNFADGVNREQAIAYQQFELDLLLTTLLAGRAAGIALSPATCVQLEAMLEHIAAIMDAGGHVPAFGDSDDGYVVRLSQEDNFSPYRSLLATGAILFERSDFRFKAGILDDKTRWLLGPDADSSFARLDAADTRLRARRAFAQGGYYVLGCEFETRREIRLVADAGPLGYGAIAAHGHADALSFTLSIGGQEFLVDPGTYTYRPDSPWRAYFRGTVAHNTVRVDGRDQSEPGGNFLWLARARATCSTWKISDVRDVFEGWHDGYRRLPDALTHRRRITLEKATRVIVIEDRLEANADHDIELLFHFSHHCRVEAVDNGFRVQRGGTSIQLRLPQAAGATADVHCASLEPRLGWVSPRFGEKVPAPTIRWQARLTNAVLRTEIQC
jgi:hypothetical protein